MPSAKSPVEKRIELMRDLWLEATADERVRIIVWRIPDNADRMLLAFFEAQRHDGDWRTPDLFLKFDQPFETGFTYSRALCDALIESYVASQDSFKEQSIAFDWPFAAVPRPDSAAGFLSLLDAFARHHRDHFRYAAAALMPSAVTSADALEAWVQAALKAGLPDKVRLSVTELTSHRRWAWLEKEVGNRVRVIDAPIDMFDIARETAAQSPGTGPAVPYRQMLTDVLMLVEKGTPTQVSARADKALAIAQKENWPDQQVVLHTAVAGSHQKSQDYPAALARFRKARECAEAAKRQGNPIGATLVMQTWFGEAGVWLMAGQNRQAAQAYRSGAEAAQGVPNRMFALEGFRMAAFCYAADGDARQAREHSVLAVREGKAIPAPERAHSTLAIALTDLMRLQDSERVAEIEKLVAQYKTDIDNAHAQAEKKGAALGAAPSNDAVDRIESQMHAEFESAFQRLRETREGVIARGDEVFRKALAIGRELLHPEWSGLPEVKHPLDKDQASWTKMPQSAELPKAAAPDELLDATPVAAAASTTQAVA